MIKKINNHLLTHYPLLWNTRIVWVLCIAILIHAGFFLAGYNNVTVYSLSHTYGTREMLDFNVVTFSIFTSIILCIIWLLFYLRNNAYKEFYQLRPWHNTKQFLLILLGFLSISFFFETYHLGLHTKIKSITGRTTYINEVNTINEAMAFIPIEKNDYFKLNNCNRQGQRAYYDNLHTYTDTLNAYYNTASGAEVRKALLEKDAFTYTNYCETFLSAGSMSGMLSPMHLKQKWEQWLLSGKKDSVAKKLETLLAILDKYKINYQLSVPELAALPFQDSLHHIHKIIARSASGHDRSYDDGKPVEANPDYLSTYELQRVMELMNEVHYAGLFSASNTVFYIIEAYFILYFSLLLLCYKLYRRKVFLVTIIGSVVITIMLALFNIANRESGTSFTEICLCVLFLFLGIFFLRANKMKTFTGASLNWHILFIPFVVLLLYAMLNTQYQDLQYAYDAASGKYINLPDEVIQQNYPVLHWIHEHLQLISALNIFLVILYIILLFLPLSKKWHLMPDE